MLNLPPAGAPDAELRGDQSDGAEIEQRFGLTVAAVFFIGFLGWAAFAPMDQAAVATARVTVANHRQTVQHREGGVIAAIRVKEGQTVEKDQVLIQLAGEDVQAQERALSSAVIGLEAQRARLVAEQLGQQIAWPEEFAGLAGADRAEAERAKRVQTAQFNTHRSTVSAQSGVFDQRAAQLDQEIQGYQRQVGFAEEQIKLIEEEIVGTRTLNERGFAPMTQVRALERARAQLESQRANLLASIASAKERIGENRLQNTTTERGAAEDIAKQIRDVEFQLNDALPKLQAAKDQLARTQIRAPAAGTVMGLTMFTVGGVVAPGQRLLDIVPTKAPLVLEAQVSPNDADDLRVGQATQVHFTGMHERGLPKLTGRLSRLSADAFVDEKTGASYFTAEVSVPASEVDSLRRSRGKDFELTPGMPAQILTPLRKRTALQYMFEPLTDAMWKSFREH